MQRDILGLCLILNISVSLGASHLPMDLLQLQIINLVWWEESHHLQAINPEGLLALLLLVHSGS